MKKNIICLFSLLLMLNCSVRKEIRISEIDNNKTGYEHYFVTLNSGKVLKSKFIFNRGDRIEVYSQGQSTFYPLSEIKIIKGDNDDKRKGWIYLSALIGGGMAMAAILLNNGATINDKNDK